MPNPYDITQAPLTRASITPGIWVIVWDHATDRPVFIGITLKNWHDKDARDQQSFYGHVISERALVGSEPRFTILQDRMTGLNPDRPPTSRRTYALPITSSFVNFADIRMARTEVITDA